MLLEEFENTCVTTKSRSWSTVVVGEIADTSFAFTGEIIERVKQFEDAYEGGYLTN